ncbi:glycoside hydrolase family 3 C-terminal domain-containing protein [Nonomuraea sp. NPDC050663]|uniref:glycoside hydrolase family 3 protein n=1 Tax=Nonomuraea sp. NPDC050663 TaxID=3364370 RepID=UPI003796448C
MIRRTLVAACLLSTLVTGAADPGLPFQDPSKPVAERVDDLLGRLTLDEKLALLHQAQAAIPRLGIAFHKNGTEALHGVGWSNDQNDGWKQKIASGTVFPQALGLGSTWDPALIQRVGSAVGDELRGLNSENPDLWGLQAWAPVVDLLRDPRAGRNEEGYSEDALLTGAISTAYGKGLQGDDPAHLKVAPVLKHYYAYNNENRRGLESSDLTPRIEKEYYQQAFRTAISANAATGVMASYNKVNGRPTHVDSKLNTEVRSWTDQTLYNVSDAWAPHSLTDYQQYIATKPEAFAAVIKQGLDSFTIDDNRAQPMIDILKEALSKGLLTEADVDDSVRSALTIRTRLGHFDPDGGPYKKITKDVVDSPAHRALNRETAGKAAVLLKNSGLLPLRNPSSAAVVGPLADALHRDWYGGQPSYQVTPLAGVKEKIADVSTGTGLERIALKHLDTGKYVTATDGDVVVADRTALSEWDLTDWTGPVSTLRNVGNGKLLGGNWGPFNTVADNPDGWYVQQQFALEKQADGSYLVKYEGYEIDEGWFWIDEPYVTVGADGVLGMGTKDQAARFAKEILVDGIAEAAKQAAAKDVAVVVVGSHPFVYAREFHDRDDLQLGDGQKRLIEAVRKANPRTVVVLETSYPVILDTPNLLWTTHAGAETGHAVADVLFGAVNPAGRLTQTWYSTDDLPSILNYDIAATGMTYLYNRQPTLYPFGHGLSYTTFGYQGLKAQGNQVSVKVTNTGRVAGDEVVQLYTSQQESRFKQPEKQLRGFQRVSLRPGESKTVTFTVDFSTWDQTRNKWIVERATHDVLVGSSSERIRQRTTLQVRGEVVPPRDLTATTRAMDFDAYSGVKFVPETLLEGDAVAGPGTISFTKARFGAAFTARAAGTGTIEIRRGATLLGTVTVSSADWSTVSAAVKAGSGDLNLVLSEGVRLSSFSLK